MALTYTELVALVRDWSNKDVAVLSDARIQDCLRYAADKCYRKLRISALENTITYNSTDLTAATTAGNNLVPSKTEITLPSDLIQFIEIREVDANLQTTRVFNEKTDLRTFNDWTANKYNYSAYWARQSNKVILSPGFNDGASNSVPNKIELHYYRRLAALNALYNVTTANYTAGLLTTIGGTTYLYFTTSGGVAGSTPYTTQAAAIAAATGNITAKINVNVSNSVNITNDTRSGTVVVGQELSGTGVIANASTGAPPKVTNVSNQNSIVVDTAQTLADNTDITFSNTTSTKYVGTLVYNWLRDENERILLNGALAEAFAYLQDDEQAQKYMAMFMSEIDELNNEDNKRNASGGNLQMSYSAGGLI